MKGPEKRQKQKKRKPRPPKSRGPTPIKERKKKYGSQIEEIQMRVKRGRKEKIRKRRGFPDKNK